MSCCVIYKIADDYAQFLYVGVSFIGLRRSFFSLTWADSSRLTGLFSRVGWVLERAGGLLEDGVLSGVPLGQHSLLLKPGELPSVVDGCEHLPHQDQGQAYCY